MLLLKLPFSAFVQLTKNWITSPNIRLYQLQWDNYHHGIHKTLYFQNEIINQSCLWDWSKGKYLQDDSQSCLFSRGVGVFDLIFLRHFLTKMRSFCAHQKGNFLNFSKLTLLLSLDHSWCPQWPIKRYRAFFWDTLYIEYPSNLINLFNLSSLKDIQYIFKFGPWALFVKIC